MYRLVVESVSSASLLRRCLPPGQADAHGDFDGQTLGVESQDKADRLVNRYPNVRYDESDPQPSIDREPTRLEADNDGVREVSEYPTNDEGEPICVGKEDGQCSRVVDEPYGVCWQHQTSVT